MLLSANKATKHLRVSAIALRRWARTNRIQCFRASGKNRLYDISSLYSTIPSNGAGSASPSQTALKREKIIYVRVSSPKQKEDLQRQREMLIQRYPTHTVISDIGSGITFKRQGLQKILTRANQGCIEEVVVAHRDRLCRFAFELIEYVLSLSNTKIVVHSQHASSAIVSEQEELLQDILAINTVFICRMQGRRAAENRKNRREEKEKEWRRCEESSSQAGSGNPEITQAQSLS
jgi:putative resolvase